MKNFEQLLIEQIPSLRRYAYALTGHYNNCDDLVQDTLERALKKQSLWIRRAKIRPWLFTLMHNLYINQIKAQKFVFSEHFSEQEEHSLSRCECPAATPEQNILLEQMKQHVQQLPLPQKEVLILVSVEGFAYEEVAKILAIPLGTVMSRLYRAREKLAEQVQVDNLVPLKRVK